MTAGDWSTPFVRLISSSQIGAASNVCFRELSKALLLVRHLDRLWSSDPNAIRGTTEAVMPFLATFVEAVRRNSWRNE
jgi:hypothetical protein